MEWQPIETAPKDRTIIVFGQPSDLILNGDKLVTFKKPMACSACWDDIDQAFCVTGGSWLGPFVMDPSHWMPLPEPPK
jgi:hypothetical protein